MTELPSLFPLSKEAQTGSADHIYPGRSVYSWHRFLKAGSYG